LGVRLNRSQGRNPRRLTGIAVGIRQCLNCGLIFSDPQPAPMNLADHYGDAKDYWDQDYFQDDRTYFSREIAEARSLLGPVKEPRALDIGAGIGKAMHALTAAGFDVQGIEPAEDFRTVALRRGIPSDRIQLAGIEEASFEPESFDFITFGAVLEHLSDPAGSIERAIGWLKPLGIIQLEVPSSKWLISRLVNLYFRLLGTTYVTNISPMHPPFHLFEFGLRSFELHGDVAGYEIAAHRFSVCSIIHFPRPLHPFLRWYMERSDTGMQLTVYLRKRAGAGLQP
jgi:2-polyprenyl-3-methyl-5-hydroxy-6-metoxy-1,4-benzoquinol methylase